jgi:hypothetical protein
VGTLVLALGIPILIAALGVQEYSVRYDDAGPMAGLSQDAQQEAIWTAPDAGLVYNLSITVEEKMEPPVRNDTIRNKVLIRPQHLHMIHCRASVLI